MDLKDASAMTEASGLSDDLSVGNASVATGARRAETPRHGPPAKAATALIAKQLRDIATAAPLRSLAAAFVIGVMVARRR
ncbi:hypothetical protein GA0061098_1014137 [Bradyrhizobium shewense]|uniref:Uncharacterized protein n=1 Tax=Bradyrhizobium shewense TaxID=1761772 RepID=A0A1C3XE14_9BRAD|nr:hypothetical protein [Bradyrhizobium shewense]SCB50346.1 hypothetical protein GA0061098_1014137 [Bradyrhizobium shewense]